MNSWPNKRFTVKDIAALAKVSTGTIDRVIHNRGEVSTHTRNKILKIIEKKGYERDILASTLASKKKYLFVVFLPSPTKEIVFWDLPLKGIQKAYSEIRHFAVTISYIHFDYYDKNDFIKQSEKVLSLMPNGILMAPVMFNESLSFVDLCSTLLIPVTLIDTNLSESTALTYIGQNSYNSGLLAAKMLHYGIEDKIEYLIVNISKRKDSYNQLRQRAKGFNDYFYCNKIPNINIYVLDIENHNMAEIENKLLTVLKQHILIKGIFVTNSRVYKIASILEKKRIKNIRLIGYDLLEENIHFLKKGTIHFIISQRPEEQGYEGIMSLFNHLVLKKNIDSYHYLPIDILTKENIDYYKF